jgi:hypothetical protein
MIASNAFMKRSFGRKLVEKCFPLWDLTYIVDTSGAFLPGHATPTAIIMGQNRNPVTENVRVVRGIRAETTVPVDPAHASVWMAIVRQIDQPGSESRHVSAADVPRDSLGHHPLPMGGGGAAELKERLDDSGIPLQTSANVGIQIVTGEDDLFLSFNHRTRSAIPLTLVR